MSDSPLDEIYLSVYGFCSHFYKLGIPRPTLAQTALKVCGEMGELAETINKNWNKKEQEKEFGDVLVTLLMHSEIHDYDYDYIAHYIKEKLEDRKTKCKIINGIIVKNRDYTKSENKDK